MSQQLVILAGNGVLSTILKHPTMHRPPITPNVGLARASLLQTATPLPANILVFSTFYKDNGVIDQNYIENHYVLGRPGSILHSHVHQHEYQAPSQPQHLAPSSQQQDP
jgi:hypothetical protein